MLAEHVKVMEFFSQAGEIIGRKKLQKMIYIAKKMEYPFSERYKFHVFGPYSEELSLRMEELCNLGFVTETMEDKGNYFQYRYSLSTEGKKFLSLYNSSIPNVKPFVNSLNQQSARFLELVSTILYFDELPPEEVKEKVCTLKRKQNYTEIEIEQAYQYINDIGEIVH